MPHPTPLARAAAPSPQSRPAWAASITGFACIGLALLAGAARAEEALPAPGTPAATSAAQSSTPLRLAPPFGPRSDLLAMAAQEPARRAAAATPAKPFEPPFFSGSNAHKYFGLGTLALVALTGLTAPGEGCEQNCPANAAPRRTSGTTHTRLARAASVMAAATVTSGLLVHWNDFHLRDGLSDPDNQHVLLGLAGSLLMMQAVNKSMRSTSPTEHAGTAALGGIAMAVAVKLTW